jgi:hypothetical protein
MLHEFKPDDGFGVGPFTIETRLLPHFVPTPGCGFPRPTPSSPTRATRAPAPASRT